MEAWWWYLAAQVAYLRGSNAEAAGLLEPVVEQPHPGGEHAGPDLAGVGLDGEVEAVGEAEPVEGPNRWTSMMTIGISLPTAKEICSL